ncbi:putative cystathionine gamma-lyase 2 [Cimex lectularius]|uniref:cystathionine gamma-lyase n=1 Tax=Cimex lectularius TaxID=79782 RepID=A0A8I6TDW2_CIMLE|nr:putative cystathionine gamma-lyase 2 [Cimex lectularius]
MNSSGDCGMYQPVDESFSTKAIHHGQDPDQWSSGIVIPPIHMGTTFKQDAPAKHRGFEYGRSGNPSRAVLEKCLASIENAKYSLAFASGLAAVNGLCALLKHNDHIIAGDDLYGGMNRYLRRIASNMGLETSFVDTTQPDLVEKAIRPNTKMLWVESPTNPLMKVMDVPALSLVVKKTKQDIIFVVDNTFLTPYFQRPLSMGADIVMYSLTKYMNGHSDIIMGSAATNSDELNERLLFIQNSMGIIPSPFDCYMVNRSLKTLAVRMKEHMKNAMEVAEYLEKHKYVDKVIFPGLKSHPQHELTKKLWSGVSGMMSFYIKGGLNQSNTFLSSLKVFTLAESLGGFESLAELPSVMTHASVPLEQRIKLGITDNLIRLSIGLEAASDLINDLEQALNAAAASG